MDVKIAGSITELDKAQWDGIAENHVMNSYGWLKTIEETFVEKPSRKFFSQWIRRDCRCFCLLYLYSGECLRKFGPCNIWKTSQTRTQIEAFISSALICSQPFTYGSHFLFRKDLDPEKRRSATNKLFWPLKKPRKRNACP